jgi:hypothetical protein
MDKFTCRLKIDGRQYDLRKMPPIDAAPFGLKVVKVFSKALSNPAAVQALDSLKKITGNKSLGNLAATAEKDNDISVAPAEVFALGLSLISVLSELDDKELSNIFKTALNSDVFVGGEDRLSEEDVFHKHFQQFPQDYYPVAVWATWNHVKDFFVGIGGGMKSVFGSFQLAQPPAAK